jgi:hypothetical protein
MKKNIANVKLFNHLKPYEWTNETEEKVGESSERNYT